MAKVIGKEEISLLLKLQKVKIDLRGREIKMTGKTKKYSYFELGDFIPTVEKLLMDYGLVSRYQFTKRKGTLMIIDTSTGVMIKWSTPLIIASVNQNGYDMGVAMKAEQAVQTYARRTLWLQALDILESNVIELEDSNSNKSTKKPQLKPKPKPQQKKTVVEKPEVTEKMVEDILNQAEEKLINAGKEFNEATALWTIGQLCGSNKELKKACINKLRLVTADEVKK